MSKINREYFKDQKQKFLKLHNPLTTLNLAIRSLVSFTIQLRNPLIFFNSLKMLLSQIGSEFFLKEKIIFLYNQEAINFLLIQNKSLIRFGDGEVFHFLNSINQSFLKGHVQQNKNKNLTLELREIISEYNSEANYVLAVNATILQMSDLDNIRSGLYSLHYQQRYFFKKFLLKKALTFYIDALLFRPESSLDNEIIEKLWEEKKIILVHNNPDTYSMFRERYPNGEMSYIKIPMYDAYSQSDIIIDQILSRLTSEKIEQWIVLVSAGVAAKALVYRLSKMNIRAYDMGHYFEWKFKNINVLSS